MKQSQLDRVEAKLDWLHEAVLSARPALRSDKWIHHYVLIESELRLETTGHTIPFSSGLEAIYQDAPIWPEKETT